MYKTSIEYGVLVILALAVLILVMLRLFLMECLVWCIKNKIHCIIFNFSNVFTIIPSTNMMEMSCNTCMLNTFLKGCSCYPLSIFFFSHFCYFFWTALDDFSLSRVSIKKQALYFWGRGKVYVYSTLFGPYFVRLYWVYCCSCNLVCLHIFECQVQYTCRLIYSF